MQDPHPKILFIGQKEADFIALRDLSTSISAGSVDIEWVANYENALQVIREGRHDIYILDHHQENRTGIELLRDAKAKEYKKPFILLTEQCVDSREDAEAILAGAADYLVKDELSAPLLKKSIHCSIQQKRTQAALRDSEARYLFMAQNTGDAFYHLRYETMSYDYLSPAITTLTGYTAEEIAEIGFSQLVKRIDLPGKENVSKKVLVKERHEGKTGELRADYLIRTKNGKWRWLRDHSFPWFDDSGELLGSTGILSDVTDIKETEESLRESERQLRFLSSKLMAVQEEEKARVSGLLHDNFGQILIALKFGVETAISAAKIGDKSATLDALQSLVPMVQHSIEEMRELYMILRPTILDDFGIIAAIDWYCREFEKLNTVIHIEKHINIVEEQLPQHLRIIIYRILQEAVQNTIKHSNARRIRVTLKEFKKNLELTIRDDGDGFDFPKTMSPDNPHKGLGLASMKERANLSGGSFQVKSGKRTGTTIKVIWPLI